MKSITLEKVPRSCERRLRITIQGPELKEAISEILDLFNKKIIEADGSQE